MLAVGNVLAALGVNVLLGEAKVDDVDDVLVGLAVLSHEEVLRLHVTVYQVLAVNILDSGYLRGGEGGRGRGGEERGEGRGGGKGERRGEKGWKGEKVASVSGPLSCSIN